MNRHFLPCLVYLTVCLLPLSADARPAPDVPPGIPSYIIVYKDDIEPLATSRELARKHGLEVANIYQHALKGAAMTIPPGRMQELEKDPRIAFIEPNQRVKAFAQTLPTGVNRVEGELNSTAGIDGVDERVDVDIAVLDTGIDLDHPDLYVFRYANCAKGGPSNTTCTENDTNADDGNGHGTHVAGTAAALDNDIGVVGVAPGARLWNVRVLDNRGSGWLNWIIGGVDYVTANAASIEVANMSLGLVGSSSALDLAITNSVAAGIVYAVAAGNDRLDVSQVSPGGHPDAITVSALADFDGAPGGTGSGGVSFIDCTENVDDSFACFSNFGSGVDIMAPGIRILSTWPGGGTHTIDGTSQATPHVAGAAALYLVENPGSSPAAVKAALIAAGDLQPCANSPSGQCADDPDGFQEPLLRACAGLDTDGDGLADVCDGDDDNDGLDDAFELSIGTNPLLADSDSDGLSDFDEVNYDGNPYVYTPGQDLDPLSDDTDGDTIGDASDPIPLTFNYADGDLAPLGSPDGVVNAADYLVALRIVLGQITPGTLELSHGDLYPSGAPDGVIDMPDVMLLLQLFL